MLDVLLLSTAGLPGDLTPWVWPPEVAPLEVAQWDALTKAHPAQAAQLLAHVMAQATTRPGQGPAAMDGFFLGRPEWTALAVLFATLQAVERDRHRRAIAIDAGPPAPRSPHGVARSPEGHAHAPRRHDDQRPD